MHFTFATCMVVVILLVIVFIAVTLVITFNDVVVIAHRRAFRASHMYLRCMQIKLTKPPPHEPRGQSTNLGVSTNPMFVKIIFVK